MCVASGLRAEIMYVPLFEGATLEDGLHGGEDYELLFTAPPKLRIPVGTKIGRITRSKRILLNGRPLEPKGFDHFA